MDFNDSKWVAWARLMERIQGGDQEAYGLLLAEMSPMVYSFVRRRVFNPTAVDDVYQEVLLIFHKARHTYQPDRPFGPWLFTVLRNAVYRSLRQMRKFNEKEVLMEEIPEFSAKETAESGMDDRMREALNRLSPKQREAVEILKVEGLDLDTASKKIGITKSALKVRAHRGYSELRRIFLGEE